MNRFVFVIPFYNVRAFIKDCYTSLLNQRNQNWIAIFADDQSTDGTTDLIPQDSRFIIKKTPHRMTALPNIHYAITDSNLNDDDIICILDGDDFLLRSDAIDIVDNLYKDGALLTYGQYMWPNGNPGHCQGYNAYTFLKLRNGGYVASHLRTFKYKLYKEILNQDPDLNCYKDSNGEYYTTCYDIAIMTPLMEMAGLENIRFNPIPIYYYRLHPNNDHYLYADLQKKTEHEIFAKSPFRKVF
jgi:glycosyltransferase involved in cell wall biosynthesis